MRFSRPESVVSTGQPLAGCEDHMASRAVPRLGFGQQPRDLPALGAGQLGMDHGGMVKQLGQIRLSVWVYRAYLGHGQGWQVQDDAYLRCHGQPGVHGHAAPGVRCQCTGVDDLPADHLLNAVSATG
jgi:hypothetical protein